jgi:hypothetical protein
MVAAHTHRGHLPQRSLTAHSERPTAGVRGWSASRYPDAHIGYPKANVLTCAPSAPPLALAYLSSNVGLCVHANAAACAGSVCGAPGTGRRRSPAPSRCRHCRDPGNLDTEIAMTARAQTRRSRGPERRPAGSQSSTSPYVVVTIGDEAACTESDEPTLRASRVIVGCPTRSPWRSRSDSTSRRSIDRSRLQTVGRSGRVGIPPFRGGIVYEETRCQSGGSTTPSFVRGR